MMSGPQAASDVASRRVCGMEYAMAKSKPADLKKKIIWVCRKMNEMGINQGTSGNVSARTEEGFLITASGVP